MTFSAAHVSNSILKRAFRDGVPVTPMKLQRILFFAAAEYSKATSGEALFGELFQAWKYGPVLPSVYDQFASFRNRPIGRYAKDATGQSFAIAGTSTDCTLNCVLDAVWLATKHLGPLELSHVSRIPGSAWYCAWTAGERYIDDQRIVFDFTYRTCLGF